MTTRAEVLAWLAACEPAAPPIVAARLADLVREAPDGLFAATLTATLNGLGRSTLERSLGRGAFGDDVALDLLAADAFVTYAFEAAAAEGVDVRSAVRDELARMVP